MTDVSAPQPGWYPDPENPAGERWWNGSGWSDEKRDATTAAGFTYGNQVATVSRPDPYAPQLEYTSSPYVAAPYGAPAYGSRANGLAIAGLIVSLAGWLFVPVLGPIAGIILSGFGLARAKQTEAAGNPNSGRGIATAGLVIGIIVAVLSLLVIVAYFGFFFVALGSTY